MKKRNRTQGFTLIEILVVLIIMSVMMGLATVLYTHAIANGDYQQCYSNEQSVANAEEQYRLRSSAHTYTTSIASLRALLPTTPVCPDGGTYSITISNGSATANNGQLVPNGQIVVSCSASGHPKYAPGIDTP
ncbi:MAG: type II secretion system protein [Armatimonadetes bacterium]|nr:type II secretion system protein [Armatimonadota bacterium]MDE2206331.1 type II secretion system protein [Armatimonadota bacterium]